MSPEAFLYLHWEARRVREGHAQSIAYLCDLIRKAKKHLHWETRTTREAYAGGVTALGGRT